MTFTDFHTNTSTEFGDFPARPRNQEHRLHLTRAMKIWTGHCFYPQTKQGMWKNEDWNFETTFSGWWFQVSTPLKNMSQLGRMTSHILWKIKHVWNHQPVFVIETMWKNEFQDGKYKSLWGLKLHWNYSNCGRMKFELTNTKKSATGLRRREQRWKCMGRLRNLGSVWDGQCLFWTNTLPREIKPSS